MSFAAFLEAFGASNHLPLCCKAHQRFVSTWLCHPHPSWITLASHSSPPTFQNVPRKKL